MVLDIEKYPEFVPWCIEGKIYDRNESADLITFNGDLKVGKSILNETFSSHVSYYKEKDTEQNMSISSDLRTAERAGGIPIQETRKSSVSRGRDISVMDD